MSSRPLQRQGSNCLASRFHNGHVYIFFLFLSPRTVTHLLIRKPGSPANTGRPQRTTFVRKNWTADVYFGNVFLFSFFGWGWGDVFDTWEIMSRLNALLDRRCRFCSWALQRWNCKHQGYSLPRSPNYAKIRQEEWTSVTIRAVRVKQNENQT